MDAMLKKPKARALAAVKPMQLFPLVMLIAFYGLVILQKLG
jgi:hypothetical protein